MEQDYRMFTGPAELHKAINTLRGIVAGISTDAKVQSTGAPYMNRCVIDIPFPKSSPSLKPHVLME